MYVAVSILCWCSLRMALPSSSFQSGAVNAGAHMRRLPSLLCCFLGVVCSKMETTTFATLKSSYSPWTTTNRAFAAKLIPSNVSVLNVHVLAERCLFCLCLYPLDQLPVPFVFWLRLFFFRERADEFDSFHYADALSFCSSAASASRCIASCSAISKSSLRVDFWQSSIPFSYISIH